MSCLKCCDARELHPFEYLSRHTAVQIAFAATKWNFPYVTDHSNMPDVVIRIAPVLSKIARVARESAIPGSWGKGIYAVINGMRPSVCALQLQAMTQTMCNFDLQRVVDRIGD